MRFLVAHLALERPVTWDELESLIPYVGRHRRAPGLLPDGGRVFKTHEGDPSLYDRAIYLTRDPRDVLLSEHRLERMWGTYGGDFDEFLADSLKGRVHGLGTWEEHVSRWGDAHEARRGEILWLRYEDLREDPVGHLAPVLDFLGLEGSRSSIEKAVAHNDLSRMRNREDRMQRWKADPELRHVGKGHVGGWRERLAPESAREIEGRWGATMTALGYPLSS